MTHRARFAAVAIASLLALTTLPSAARAWHDGGHATIALLAYRELPAGQRARLDDILAHHARYQQDLLAGCPEGADKKEYAFTRAAVWPDTVRSRSNPMSAAHSHPLWHYTDVPYYPEGGEDKYTFTVPAPARPGEPYDAVSAWKYSLARLSDPSVSDAERAVSLCWVLHLGGDIHQPLHCVSLFSAKMPAGDKGGNSWLLTIPGDDRPQNLHFIWDALLGDGLPDAAVHAQADEVARAHPSSEFAEELKKTSIDDWTQEGRQLAINYVYLGGRLQAATKAEVDAGAKPPGPPAAYRDAALAVSKRQAALAGYRIGAALTALALPQGAPAAPATQP